MYTRRSAKTDALTNEAKHNNNNCFVESLNWLQFKYEERETPTKTRILLYKITELHNSKVNKILWMK